MASDDIKNKTFPLHKAIRHRNITKIKLLLPTIKDINEKNGLGYPPLLYACEQENNEKMLEVLFEQQTINPFATDNEHQNAVHILAFKGQLSWIVKFFEKFPKVSADEVTTDKDTPLIMAAKMDHTNVIEYLCKRGANINHMNQKGFTALHYAANNGYVESTKKIIELGAKLNSIDDRGCTPLTKACSWGFVETCKVLLENGADVEPKFRQVNYTALIQATQRGHLEIIKLLLTHGANPNYAEEGDYLAYSALATACSYKNIDAMKVLIQNGADVNFPGKFSQALFVCIKKDFTQGIQELIKAGVDLKGRHYQSKRTGLETATKLRKFEIVKLLESHM